MLSYNIMYNKHTIIGTFFNFENILHSDISNEVNFFKMNGLFFNVINKT